MPPAPRTLAPRQHKPFASALRWVHHDQSAQVFKSTFAAGSDTRLGVRQQIRDFSAEHCKLEYRGGRSILPGGARRRTEAD